MKLISILFLTILFAACEQVSGNKQIQNQTAFQEQNRVEQNQAGLNRTQPSPRVDWSLERDNLIKRFKLQNDRSVIMYMYIFNYGISYPIGFYQVNKVSSVNSQLTNPEQIVLTDKYDTPGEYTGRTAHVLPSPAEDGSYGTNGDAIFGFTPDDVYIEHNMLYMCSTAPLNFPDPVNNLGIINVADLEALKVLMDKL